MLFINYYFIIGYLIICLHINFSQQVALKGVNVRNAEANEYPFAVWIGMKKEASNRENPQFCTGTLISKKHVLTAGHCITDLLPINVELRIGSVDLERAIKYQASHWITYRQWKDQFSKFCSGSVPHDIAIITLDSSVPDIEPAKLYETTSEDLSRLELKIAGWGYTSGHVKPTTLKVALLYVITNQECNDHLGVLTNEVVQVDENMFCSKAVPWILSDCGDSGGPSIDKDNRLVGITIGRCPQEKFFAQSPAALEQDQVILHVSVNYYKDFIESVTKND